MPKMKLSDIGSLSRGKSKHRPRNDKILYGGKYPFIQTSDIKNANHILQTYAQTYNEFGLKQSKLWKKNTICITIAANIADSAILGFDACFPDSVIGLTVNDKVANYHYVEYLLQYYKKTIQNQSNGTSQENINLETFEQVYFDIPSLNKQNNISNILYAIDKKIELNNKINSELEKVAKNLYDYWFVQFDFPDEFGRPYKSSGGKMVYNERLKREIPEGWGVGNLYSIADYYNGLACQKFRPSYNESYLPVVKIGEMHNGINTNTEFVKANIPAKNIIDSGDILFSWSATLEVMLWTGNKAGLNQHIFKVVPKINYTREYVYQQLSSYVVNFVRIAEARKTTMGHITTEHLKQSKITLAPKFLIETFSNKTRFIYEKMIECRQENLHLVQIREFLLPMLMNGQVSIQR